MQFGREQMRFGQRQAVQVQLAFVALRFRIALPVQTHQFITDHHARQAGAGFVARVAVAGNAAAAHDGGAVAQGANFIKLVADVQNAATFGGQLAQRDEQFFHGLRGQHGSRLVENQQLRIGQQRAHDFHALPFADRQRMHMACRFQFQTIFLTGLANACAEIGQIGVGIQAEGDILRHGQGIEQRKMLKHHGNTELARDLRIADMHHLAIPADVAGIGFDGAENDFHQCRFAGAVLAQHGMNFARRDAQVDIVVGEYPGIRFADMRYFQSRGGSGHIESCSYWHGWLESTIDELA